MNPWPQTLDRWFRRLIAKSVVNAFPFAVKRRKSQLGLPVASEERVLLAGFSEFVDPHPAPGNSFGYQVVPLSTGNVVITAPLDDAGGADAGAVYLFNGSTGALISTLTGSNTDDHLGLEPVQTLTNGNFLIRSDWDNGAATDAGAITWGSGITGVSGTVGPANSLVGSQAGDRVGAWPIVELTNGNFVVPSPYWANGTVLRAGAVTWGNGSVGISGVVSAANSLVGASTDDNNGDIPRITALTNGNYVVNTGFWDNGNIVDAGAVTWGNGTTGVSGLISSANSLVGSHTNDLVGGIFRAIPLSNGNYVISSPSWDNGTFEDAGAVTWGNGTTGISGLITAANSLVGDRANCRVGIGNGNGNGNGLWAVTALSNGNYVISSPEWDSDTAINAGAVTWGNGLTGVSGVISTTNSLIGKSDYDKIGESYIYEVKDGNFVVGSPNWSNGPLLHVGAITWVSGTVGTQGYVSVANSLIGGSSGDCSGGDMSILKNGNYIVLTPNWQGGSGAVTWGDGATGVTGVISSSKSLVGNHTGDSIGGVTFNSVSLLSDGDYVIASPAWDKGAYGGIVVDAGAVTWCSGTTGRVGLVSEENSIVGSQSGDYVGREGVKELVNGNFVVISLHWRNGASQNAGAVTWVNGTTGLSGPVNSINSLVGSLPDDFVGEDGIIPLVNGNYLVNSSSWDLNASATDVGSVTWGNGTTGIAGVVSPLNSLVGSTTGDAVGQLPGLSVSALTNGNYVVGSDSWDNGVIVDAGAVTWGNGSVGTVGFVSMANSLVGTSDGDRIGGSGTLALPDGNYVTGAALWDNGTLANAGAATWGNGRVGTTGAVSAGNSIVGLSSDTEFGRSHLNPGWGSYSVVLDHLNNAFYAPFSAEGSGRVRVGTQAYAPVFPGPYRLTIEEYTPQSTLIGTVKATDVEGDAISYSIVSGDPNGVFAMSSNGKLYVKRQNLTGLREQGSFKLRVRATDNSPGALSSETDVTVYLKPAQGTRVNPVADGDVLDVDANGFSGSDTLTVNAPELVVRGGTNPSRGLLEFNLGAVPAGKVLKNITLYFAVSGVSGGSTVSVPVDVYGYAGNGSLAALDATLGTKFGSRTITNAGGIDPRKVYSVSLDPALVRSLGSSTLGLVLRNDGTADGLSVSTLDSGLPAEQKPYLVLQYADIQDDLIVRDQGATGTGNEFLVLKSNGSSFSVNAANVFAVASWERFVTGDFNGDGQTDIAGRLSTNGEWWISLANASGVHQAATKWGKWSTTLGMVDMNVADLDGDGKGDLIGRTSTGSWLALRSTGVTFGAQTLGTWSTATAWRNVMIGDFNRDGRADIVGRDDTSKWFVSLTAGPATAMTQTTSQWGAWKATSVFSDIMIGDFNGDGRSDIIGRSSLGAWGASESTGAKFGTGVTYGNWSTTTTWSNVQVADFNGDGRSDIVGRSTIGQWYVSEGDPIKFKSKFMGTFANPQSQWGEVVIGDFNSDGRADIVSRNTTTHHLWTSLWSPTGWITTDWATLPTPATHTWRLQKSAQVI